MPLTSEFLVGSFCTDFPMVHRSFRCVQIAHTQESVSLKVALILQYSPQSSLELDFFVLVVLSSPWWLRVEKGRFIIHLCVIELIFQELEEKLDLNVFWKSACRK